MHLLADENVPRVVVEALREAGHDVVWVREALPGVADDVVLARAAAEQRVLLTFDKDFGEHVFRLGVAASRGVVLLRVLLEPVETARLVVDVLAARSDWPGHFSVVELDRVRMRPLPGSVG